MNIKMKIICVEDKEPYILRGDLGPKEREIKAGIRNIQKIQQHQQETWEPTDLNRAKFENSFGTSKYLKESEDIKNSREELENISKELLRLEKEFTDSISM